MANTTIEDVLKRNSLYPDSDIKYECAKSACIEWASLQTPSNEKYWREILDFDFWKSSEYEPVEEGNYQGLYRHKYDMKGSGTFYTAKELLEKYLKATETESTPIPIQTPCDDENNNLRIQLDWQRGEIERLKGLIEIVYFNPEWQVNQDEYSDIQIKWQQFKTENNL